MENLSYLVAAYGAIWVVLFYYVFSLLRKQTRIEEDLQRLKDKMEREGSSRPSP